MSITPKDLERQSIRKLAEWRREALGRIGTAGDAQDVGATGNVIPIPNRFGLNGLCECGEPPGQCLGCRLSDRLKR